MYTYDGDADLTGNINGDDYFRIDQGYATRNNPTPLLGYENGDFNFDGKIDADDYFIIDRNYSRQGMAFSSGAALGGITADFGELSRAVPEPAGLVLLGSILILRPGRRRGWQRGRSGIRRRDLSNLLEMVRRRP